MRLIIKDTYDECSEWTARYIASKINDADSKGNQTVLGLPTGSTPLGVYKNLIEMNRQKKVSFKNVITFNMDEYVGLSQDNEQSYHYFMHHNFFDYIDIKQENIHILDGMTKNPEEECQKYEDAIKECGGIDLFLGGTGIDGHIAFNEPFSSIHSRTREKTLTTDTRIANSRFFGGDMQKVPKTALTVGIATILSAKEVVIMMNGHAKAKALQKAVEGAVSQEWPVSALQLHDKAIIVADEDCIEQLKYGTVKYFKDIEKGQF